MRSEIFGYQVKKNEDPNLKYFLSEVAYLLIGKRGATYQLVRHVNQPSRMYVVNSKGNICGLKGNYSFSDKNGDLKVYDEFEGFKANLHKLEYKEI